MSGSTHKALLAGGLAGAFEACVTMPFEVTKNRIQLRQGPPTVLASMADTVRCAGPTGLFYGLQSQLLQVSGKAAIRFAAYDRFRFLGFSAFTAGTLAGVTEAVVWVAPTERLKVLRQSELGGAAGTGSGASLFRAFRAVVHTQGIGGLWIGAVPTAARNAVANGVRFFLFERIRSLLPDTIGGTPAAAAAMAGGMTGVFSVVLTNPLDIIKTKLQAAPLPPSPAAASSAPPPPSGGLVGRVTRLGRVGAAEMSASAAVLRSMVRDEGAMALTRGMSARLVKISVGQALIFGAYDAIRRRV